MDVDPLDEPLATDANGQPVYLKDLWPSQHEIHQTIEQSVKADMYRRTYREVFSGDTHWSGLEVPAGERFVWDPDSTYIKHAPYFVGMSAEPAPVEDIADARCLALLGDSVTTDHISPAGTIAADSPAGRYLIEHGVDPAEFNSYGSRRGNHEVMMRGTFANVRLRNQLAPGTEGGWTAYQPDGDIVSIFDAAMRYQEHGTPLIVIAGKEYGTGSSRDWAAKGTRLLGVRAVLAESYERIHRSNLVGMGVLPLQFQPGDNADGLRLTGRERFDIRGLDGGRADAVEVTATPPQSEAIRFQARVRIDTPREIEYFRHGGILRYVLRGLLEG